jgi:hypothetical protein
MAKIYPVYGGKQHGSWGERPWPRCVELLELDEFCRTEDRPTFDFPERVVVRIEASEARQHGIDPGFFVSPLDGLTARSKLDNVGGAWGRYLRFLLPAALAVALLTGSAEATNSSVVGFGLSSCRSTSGVYEQWVVGFHSGIGYQASTGREMTLWLGWTLMAFGPG